MNTYNARDQLTLIRQHQGAEDPNSVHQDTTFTYDGFGRLQTKHTPQEQLDPNNGASTDHTTWSYKPDDTVETIADARGAVQTLTYNNRHLVTNITYSAPAGISATAPVTYDYDAAGNRISTIDGMGSMSYVYDPLSRMTSETRTFTFLGAFQLSYAYNLADALTRVTDPFGAQINYNFDAAGRVESVTGSGFGNVSTYASNIQYRAWGEQKSATYGDGATGTTTYDARMRPAAYDFPAMREQFQYYDDGRLKQMTDLDDRNQDIGFPDTARHFSRVRSYDQVGRLTSDKGTPLESFPYRQSYSYDAFNNPTGRFGAYYYQNPTSTGSGYLNNRRLDSTYFADGQVKHSPLAYDVNHINETISRDWTYDAAGRMVQVQERVTSPSSVSTYTSSYDGDGRSVKESIATGSFSTTLYMIRSAVLDGQVVTTLDSSGAKQRTTVNVDKRLLAVQSSVGGFNSVNWTHLDPLSMSESGINKPVYDALGNHIPWQHAPTAPPNAYPPHSPSYGSLGSGFGASQDSSCAMDGTPTSCDRLARAINAGLGNRLVVTSTGNVHVDLLKLGLVVTEGIHDETRFWGVWAIMPNQQNPTYSSGGQLSPCLRDVLRQFFPAMKVHGKSYSPVDDARFKSGIPSVLNIAQDNNAVTLGLYDIHFNPDRVNLNGGNFDSLDTIVEEVAHTVQFLQTWDKQYQAIYIAYDMGGYDAAKSAWATDYAYYAAKGRYKNGDGYKNDVEKWAKNRKFDILSALLSDKKLVQQGNVCGYDLTKYSLERPDW